MDNTFKVVFDTIKKMTAYVKKDKHKIGFK